MRVRNMMLFAFVAVFSAAAQGTESEAWWDICDGCTSDSDFSSRALQIPAPYERVYISNSLTNETRRFQRTIILDDLWGGASQTIFANEQPLTAQEAQVFEETIENSGQAFETIPRDWLDYLSGLSGRDSVVGDLTTGRLSGGLLSGLKTFLRDQGYAGAKSHVEAAFGFDFILSYNASVNLDDLRTQPLTVRITYPDDSFLQIEFAADLNTVLSVSAIDAEGTEIPFEAMAVAPAYGAEYSFRTANEGWVDTFRVNLDAVDGYSCSSWTAEDYIVVICSRP